MVRRALAALLSATLAMCPPCALAAAAASQSPASANAGLERLLAAQLARFPSHSGVYVKNLRTGEEAAVLGDAHFESASTIKLAVMILAFQLADAGKLDLAARYDLKPQDYRAGSGVLRFLDPGARLTTHDLIELMIAASDNTATDIMIGKVGGPDAVNAFLRRAGYRDLTLNKTVGEHFRWRYEVLDPKYQRLSPEDVFALQSNAPAFAISRQALIASVRAESAARDLDALVARANTQEGNWLGVVTPRELGRMLEAIERDEAASKAACEDMKRMLRAQQAGQRKIPHFLNVPVAHKTGENTGVTHDAGLIYARAGTVVMVSLNTDVTGSIAEADDRIGNLARLMVDYFDGAR
jgi:beta-lactamase class A